MARILKGWAPGDSREPVPAESILLGGLVATLAAFSLFASGFDPVSLAVGLGRIVVQPDILINDYVGRSGLGPALMNSALCALAAVLALRWSRVTVSGPAIAAVFTIAGFSLFGKNVANIWPSALGVFLFSMVGRRPFSENIIVALFGTAMAPLFSEVAFGMGLPLPWNLAAGAAAGVAAGFVLSPIARNALDFHHGYNLYNIGFTAGLIGTVALSTLKAFGIELSESWTWAVLGPLPALPVMAGGFLAMIAGGMSADRGWFASWRQLLGSGGRLPSDFVRSFGMGATLVNMGVMGLAASVFALAIGASWNGPIIGAILTVTGFAAFGKHPFNALPPMLGVLAMAALTRYGISAPASQLAAIFAATLAPISGGYGPVAGFFAGALHLVLVQVVGVLHGGINLYNNGFAGGITAGIMVPVLEWIREWRRHEV